MTQEFFIVNSENTEKAYINHVKQLFKEYKYLSFPNPRIGPDRSLPQNALLHVWITDFCSHLANCSKKCVTEGMIEGCKRTLKGWFYNQTKQAFMLHTVTCPITGRSKVDYTSSSSWKQGEMYMFLNWFQLLAGERGCILESKGEHAALTRKQNV